MGKINPQKEVLRIEENIRKQVCNKKWDLSLQHCKHVELNKYTDYNRNIDYGYIVLMSLFKKNSPNTDYISTPPLGGGGK